MVTEIQARNIVASPLPNLNEGPHMTKFSAIHDLKYVGALSKWPRFAHVVEFAFCMVSRNPSVSPPKIMKTDIALVGDKNYVQGRFLSAIGDRLGLALRSMMVDLEFGGFKCSGINYNLIPDIIELTQGRIVLVGKLKVPWDSADDITGSIFEADTDNHNLRVLLAQPLRYMKDLNAEFGFLSSYQYTVFLRQSLNLQGI
ncbi:hypothetical protein N7495_008360 [Penicillium taxi]|uniref:uncharacterized protein n=1 Tax=Penicillium taxi TaxID=168475 RepID=UPI002545195D|nr:uncharacterized protein N7495_008360 [Penicillium taxi]KAJ5888319.1 hypothetical protein N7495_008360 [Penicillium taxi]